MVGLRFVLRVGRRGAIRLPRRVMRELGINEGDYLIASVKGDKIILEVMPDPFLLAVRTKKWATVSIEEFERWSEVEQEESLKDTS